MGRNEVRLSDKVETDLLANPGDSIKAGKVILQLALHVAQHFAMDFVCFDKIKSLHFSTPKITIYVKGGIDKLIFSTGLKITQNRINIP
jgi:hypothetical protein